LLFGFDSNGERGRYSLYGNIWKGNNQAVAFESDEGPASNEWGHYAIGWDGQSIVIYYNGVPVGKTPFTGPRQTLGSDSGAGNLFIGGSDHQNLIGRIAQVRGYENNNPRAGSPESSFTPKTLFSRDGQFLSCYFRPSNRVADLSPTGYGGTSHPGTLCGVLFGSSSGCDNCRLPKYVLDASAPNFADTTNPGRIIAPFDTPAAPTPGSLVFDSFSRANSTYILNGAGGLGTSETGQQCRSGQVARQPFGILNGRAVLLAD
jgi:hypothetical protein